MRKSTVVMVLAALLVLGVWIVCPWAGARGGGPARVTPASQERSGAARQQAHEDWEVFRSTFPLHLQTLAVARDAAGAPRTLIISEPPPRVTLAGLKEAAPRELGEAEVEQWTVGFDGWVRDVVVPLAGMDQKSFESLRDTLSAYLYGTKYKAFAIEVPVDPGALAMSYPLDVRVSTANLEGWYGGVGFVPVERPTASPVLLKDAPLGVFMSREPGLVAWVAPKSGLERCAVECRKFAIDSDLILGAVGRQDSVVIFGRERVAPYAVLPPLRAETVMDLAAARENSLSQSYERPLFGAGGTERGWDWAPIYLSDVLLDSEYGSLLNQGDQMLKSWSCCGLVDYYNFPCAPPGRMPFDCPLLKELDTSELLFNWNTTGFGVGSEEGNHKLYAITRTGALPVTYEAGGDGATKDPKATAAVARAEDQAYQYFASLDNPVLARVVQYASLYQMFRANGVTAAPRAAPSWEQGAALEKLVLRVLPQLRDLSPAACDRAVDAFITDLAERAPADEKPAPAELERKRARWKAGTREFLDEYREHDRAIDPEERRMLVKVLARSRTSQLDPTVTEAFLEQHPDVRWLAGATSAALKLRLCGVTELQEMFSGTRSATTSGWIRTPTVVYSRTTGQERRLVGGTDLDSVIFRIVRDPTQRAGAVRVAADGRVFVNPAEAGVLERNVRQLARAGSAQEVIAKSARLLKEAKPEPARSLEVLLARRTNLPREIRGGSSKLHVHPAGGGAPPRKPPPPPGTLPPQGARPDGDVFSLRPGDKESLVFGRKNGIIFIERQRNGKPIGEARRCWSDQDAAHFLRGELENSGRSIDGGPLDVVFDESWLEGVRGDRAVDHLMNHVAQQVERGECKVLYNARAADVLAKPVGGLEVLAKPFGGVERIGIASEARMGGNEVLINITLRTTEGQDILMAMTMRMQGPVPEVRFREVTKHCVEEAVNAHPQHQQFPGVVRRNMINELKALEEWSGTCAHIGGFGDHPSTRLDGDGEPTRVALGAGVDR